jgi:hypothetical protein
VGEALHHAACKLLKRACRCRQMAAVRGTGWTAHGYFAVPGELALAFLWAQKHRESLRPAEGNEPLEQLFDSLQALVASPPRPPSDESEAWMGHFDWLLRDVTDLAVLAWGDRIADIHSSYSRAVARLHASFPLNQADDTQIPELISWLDAFEIVLATYESHFRQRAVPRGAC